MLQTFSHQTCWLIVALLAIGTLLVYRLRVRQISRQLNAQFEERTRLAHELHDTFLQTIQGSKLVVDHALKDSADHERVVRALGQLSQWLDQATEEGRAALNSLRS